MQNASDNGRSTNSGADTSRIIVGDCLKVMPTLEANSFDSIVTDPPYHLTTGKRGGCGQASVNLSSPHGRARIGTGFMGMKWDGGDVAMRPETWAEALRVAKPGAFLAAFGGTRTYHRMACAIEDAGWELRDTLMWLYGSGFPKSHNGEWGGTALKPAWEPIVLARKPLIGTVEANWREHGTGALNIDGCRVPAEPGDAGRYGEGTRPGGFGNVGADKGSGEPCDRKHDAGRWPANVVHDGSDEVIACFPDAPGQQGDLTGNEPSAPFKNTYGAMGRAPASQARVDTGSAARFFYCAKADRADRNDGCDALDAKPSLKFDPTSSMAKDGRRGAGVATNHHPTVKPTDLMRWLCRLVTPPGGLILDPFCGSGSTARAAQAEGMRCIGIEERADYAEIAEARIRAQQPGLGF